MTLRAAFNDDAPHTPEELGEQLFFEISESPDFDVQHALDLIGKGAKIWPMGFRTAAFDGYGVLVQAMLDKGFPVDAKTPGDGTTALMSAAKNGAEEVVKILLDHGADVNEINDNGQTALMFAACAHRMNVTRLLFSHGADVSLRSRLNETALGIALKTFSEDDPFIGLLQEEQRVQSYTLIKDLPPMKPARIVKRPKITAN